MSYSGEDMA